jgi:hypothetical protein
MILSLNDPVNGELSMLSQYLDAFALSKRLGNSTNVNNDGGGEASRTGNVM